MSRQWEPCPHCGNEKIVLLGNVLTATMGAALADCYCQKCGAKAPQKVWNTRLVPPARAVGDAVPTDDDLATLGLDVIQGIEPSDFSSADEMLEAFSCYRYSYAKFAREVLRRYSAQPAAVEQVCGACDGVGERMVYMRPTPDPQDAYDAWGECSECNGTGEAIFTAPPAQARPVVPEYISAMGEAGDRYIKSVALDNKHTLPNMFRWSDLWDVLNKAAAPPARAVGDELVQAVKEAQTKLAALRLIVWGGRSGQPYQEIACVEESLRQALLAAAPAEAEQ